MNETEYLARDRHLLDVRAIAVALLRGWRFLASLAVLGALAGLALTAVLAPTYEARTALLLARVPSDDVNPASAMTTEAQVASSLRVSGSAARRLQTPVPADDLLADYRVTVRTDHVLEVTASARTAEEAVERARAVGAALLDFRRSQLERELAQGTETLTRRRADLEAEVTTLSGRINELSRAVAAQTGRTDPVTVRELEAALTQRDERNNEIATLGRRIADTALEATQATTGSRVLDPPVLPDAPVSPSLLFDVAGGLVLGLALGAGVFTVGEVVGVRARWRQDVAAAAGAPVLVEVPWRRARPGRWRRRRGRGMDEAALRRGARTLARSVAVGAPATAGRTLALVSLGADRAATELAVGAAMDVAATGVPCTLAEVPAGRRSLLVPRLRLPGPGRTVVPAPPGPGLDVVVLDGDDLDHGERLDRAPARAGCAVVLSCAAARPHWARLAAVADTAALVVVAGDADEVAMRGAARDLAAVGVPVRFVVLVGPDPLDQSSGRGFPIDALGPSPLLPTAVPTWPEALVPVPR